MTSPNPGTIPRRHDLDALRAAAMLLGIALHAAITFMPMAAGGWPVQDVHQHAAFNWFMAAIHGFRMPLFFLISGFFTAMLWRKRGLKSLLWQRFRRIFLPLLLGMFTIIPATWIAIIMAVVSGAGKPPPLPGGGPDADIWAAARSGDIAAINRHAKESVDLDGHDGMMGLTPLSVAAMMGHTEAVESLIELGADVNARNRDGATPLHGAAFFGRAGVARLLVANGADASALDGTGQNPLDTSKTGPWLTQFVAGIMQVELSEEDLTTGRQEVGQVLKRSTIAVLPNAVGAESEGDEEGPVDRNRRKNRLAGWVMFAMVFPFFYHLWFLWFLCWLVVAFAVYAKLAEWLKWKGAPEWFVLSPVRFLWLIPLTVVAQSFMGRFLPMFGPDTSVGILPIPQVLLFYAIFFGFGVFYFDCDDSAGRVGRLWWLALPLGLLIIFPLGYEFTTGEFGFREKMVDPKLYRPFSVALQVVYTWMMTFAAMGLCQRLLARESKAVRYISDSSYWLYLTHLPLIILAQMFLRDLQMPALVKFGVICVVVCALLLLTYQLFVRYTPIGSLLNGPRKRPQRA